MRFTHIDVNFDIKYDGYQKPSKCAILATSIFDIKIDVNMCEPHKKSLWPSMVKKVLNRGSNSDNTVYVLEVHVWTLV